MSDQKNLLLAIVISLVVLLGWEYFYAAPQRAAFEAQQASVQTEDTVLPDQSIAPAIETPSTDTIALVPREEALSDTRVIIDTARIKGSIALTGARFDDLTLKDYWTTTEREENIHLLSPANTANAYGVEFGWLRRDGTTVNLPDQNTRWQSDQPRLTTDTPVTLSWSNGQGLVFKRRIEIDQDYLFTIEQSVENEGNEPIALYPFAKITRSGEIDTRGFFVLHEGALGVINGTLEEMSYDDMVDDRVADYTSLGGWVGMTDQYWMTALMPNQEKEFSARFLYRDGERGDYVVSYREAGQVIAPQSSTSIVNRFFAGAKEVDVIERYGEDYNIQNFDLTIDWGWFRFLTKPIFYGLDLFNGILGNVGLAIIALTLLIKLIMFPMANKSFAAMGRMKKAGPRIKELQERYKDDKMRQQQEIAALFKKEKLNPVGGCLPMLVQIPVFFALYKVLFVTIEMRHAPFYGWIKDLSAPDPLTPVNLFGLLPFDPPSFLAIGILPIIMGFTMWLTQKFNPTPTDPVQAQVMNALPFVFTFIMAPFAAGLVIYWIWNNVLTILQQWVIQRKVEAEA